jgi:DNA primase
MKRNKDTESAPVPLPVPLSNPDKVFWPNEGYTKRDLADYYNAIFPKLLPYVKHRMLRLERCPDGMRGECFFQKQKPKSMPAGTPVKRLEHVAGGGGFTDYVVGGSVVTQLVEYKTESRMAALSRMHAPRRSKPSCHRAFVPPIARRC